MYPQHQWDCATLGVVRDSWTEGSAFPCLACSAWIEVWLLVSFQSRRDNYKRGRRRTPGSRAPTSSRWVWTANRNKLRREQKIQNWFIFSVFFLKITTHTKTGVKRAEHSKTMYSVPPVKFHFQSQFHVIGYELNLSCLAHTCYFGIFELFLFWPVLD